jgi:hypothetical protein
VFATKGWYIDKDDNSYCANHKSLHQKGTHMINIPMQTVECLFCDAVGDYEFEDSAYCWKHFDEIRFGTELLEPMEFDHNCNNS